MHRDFSPKALDVEAFAQAGAVLSERSPLADFERLRDETEGPADDRQVVWSATGRLQRPQSVEPEPWIDLQASATLPMLCQRCLLPVEVALTAARRFRFVADEATAAVEDEAAEDEDVLVASRDFDLLALVEDELLMEVPAVPRHEVCPVDVKLSAGDDVPVERPNPFAVLGSLARDKTR